MPPTFYNLLSLFARRRRIGGAHRWREIEAICFLVCRYASSLGLAARQFTPAIDWCRHLPSKWYIISTPAQFSSTLDGTGAGGPRSEGGRRILLDNSRVYVRFFRLLW